LLRPGGHVLEVFRVLHLLEMIPNFEYAPRVNQAKLTRTTLGLTSHC